MPENIALETTPRRDPLCADISLATNKYVGPPYTRAKIYAACMSRGSSSSRSISAARARPQQQTLRPPLLLLSIKGTDGRTLDRFMMLAEYYADRVITLVSLHVLRLNAHSRHCDNAEIKTTED